MTSIQIFTGTMTGTAEGVSEVVAKRLQALGHIAEVNLQPDAAALLRNPAEVILICTSNTGSGDLPDDIQPLYLELTRSYPTIAGRRYGCINLGDSCYTSFNEGGAALDAAFADLGAVRIGEPLVIDASEGEDPEALALEWLEAWVKLL